MYVYIAPGVIYMVTPPDDSQPFLMKIPGIRVPGVLYTTRGVVFKVWVIQYMRYVAV